MTPNEYNQTIADLAAIGRFHRQMTPAHLGRDCTLCQSLEERCRELVTQWGYIHAETKT